MKIVPVTPPEGELIELSAAKIQARVDGTDEDSYLSATLIPAARLATERYLHRPLRPASYQAQLSFREFQGPILIAGFGPVVVSGITYLDVEGLRQTIPSDEYESKEVALGSVIVPMKRWPSGTDPQIDFDCGFDPLPEDIALALLLLIAEMYISRELSAAKFGDAELGAYGWLLNDYRCGIGL
jgi:hypothetical protein